MSGDPTSAIPHCFHTDVCPNCGYSLAGLPDAALCPECGRNYDQSQIILYGWARGRHENLATARGSRLFWLFFASVGWLVLQSFQLIFNRANLHWFLALVAGVVVVIFKRSSVDHPGLIQVRLDERECVQHGSLSGPSLITELFRAYIWLVATCIAAGMFVAFERRWMDPVLFWILIFPATAAAIALWFECRRFREAIALVPDRAIADRNAAFNRPVLWKNILRFSLNFMSDDTYRLRIRRRRPILTEYPVDAEIRCTAEQAKHLQRWLSDRLAAARADGG